MRIGLMFLVAWTTIAPAAITPAQFFARRDYKGNGSGGAGFVRVADVNGDKIPDIVELSFGTEGTIETLLGNGDGTFRIGPISPAGLTLLDGLVATDLNGDGIIDLVIAGGENQTGGPVGISVCIGKGDGTFQATAFYQAGTDTYISDLVMGDFNGDGIPDAVTTGPSGAWLFTGKGDGVFNPGVVIAPVPPGGINGASGGRLAAADFNGDGNLDLAVAINGGFVLLLGNGNGTFQPMVTYSVPPGGLTYLAVGDMNGDGYPDVVLSPTSAGVSYVNLLFNNGKGQFSKPLRVDMGAAVQITVGDVNGDKIPDIVNVLGTIVYGKGDGTYTTPVFYPVESSGQPQDVTLGDLHSNGVMDIVAAEFEGVSVLLNQGKNGFEDGEWVSVPGAINCAAAGDFNGDGKPDLAVPAGGGIVILLGTGKASSPYTTGATIPVSAPGCPIAGDLNGDGIPDILVGADGLGGVGAYLNNGDATFTLAGVVAMGPTRLATGDFNHDGKLDFATTSNQLVLGNGDGTFQPPVSTIPNPPPLGYDWIASGDVNNDGWTDLVLVQWETSTIYVLVNNQQGGFKENNIQDTAGPQGVALADLNLDGNLDAVIWPVGLNNAQVYLGNGKGGFTLQTQTPAYPGLDTIMLSIGDVNGDGIPDLLLPADGSLGIAYGKGDGTFESTIGWGVGGNPAQILLENLNSQAPGLADIVSPDGGGGVTVLINTTAK